MIGDPIEPGSLRGELPRSLLSDLGHEILHDGNEVFALDQSARNEPRCGISGDVHSAQI
jgi:hypothetical protein